jgi:hypothetical protein
VSRRATLIVFVDCFLAGYGRHQHAYRSGIDTLSYTCYHHASDEYGQEDDYTYLLRCSIAVRLLGRTLPGYVLT